MAWSATVAASNFAEGRAEVVVDYTDGTLRQREVYRTDAPDADWIPTLVRDRLARLDASAKFVLPPGPITPAPPISEPPIDPTFLLLLQRLHLAEQVNTLVVMGALLRTDARVIALRDWLAANVPTYWRELGG